MTFSARALPRALPCAWLRTRPCRRRVALAASALALLGVSGCAVGPAPAPPSGTGPPAPALTGSTPSGGGPHLAPPEPSPTPSALAGLSPALARCVRGTDDRMTQAQRLGQLVMVGLPASASHSALDDVIAAQHLGGVFLLGTWRGSAVTARATAHLQDQAGPASTGGVGLLVAADQEGGAVQRLQGKGFSTIPSALSQGLLAPDDLRERAETWGSQLSSAGVNVDLAPVAGTVPSSLGTKNQPLGRYHRELGHDPGQVAPHVGALVEGLRNGGVEPTLKHFPGLGRVSHNTDTSASRITDRTMAVDDPYLEPFAEGVRAGARIVMVSLARYPRIDPDNPAALSQAVVTDLLRDRVGFAGVVVSDDLDAAALAGVPVRDRAVRFVRAGGDLLLAARATDAGVMVAALRATAAQDPGFAATLGDAVLRVLALKAGMGLLPCGS